VTFHAEAVHAPVRLARQLRAMGARAGIAVKPVTPIEPYLELLDEFDLILVMTVEPGFGGQQFLAHTLPKVRTVREAVARSGLEIQVQVDGGVNAETIERCARAGADVFVAGSAVYGAEDAAASIEALRALALRACD
jgi:ribulose-phosphate 3-epimerase